MQRKAVWGGMMVAILTIPAAVDADERHTNTMPAAQREPAGGSATSRVLLITYAGLQTLDVVSTAAALRNGAVESNPLLGSAAGTPGRMLAAKAITTAATLGCVRAIEKKNKKAAAATMLVINSVTAVVVANNLRHARR